MKLTVGLVQLQITSSKTDNVQRALDGIAQCAARSAGLVLLPEMFCCPYELPLLPACAEPRGGFIWQALAAAARTHRIYLLGGSIPERGEDGKLYNTSFFFSPQGEELARYRKSHLFDIRIPGGMCLMESETISPGRQLTVVETPYGKIGLAICFDLRFPELFRKLADAGARLFLVPAAFNMTTGPAHWELNCRSRALDNQCFLFACAPARDPQARYVYYGHSLAVSPWGEVLGQLSHSPSNLLVQVELDEVTEVRNRLPLLKSRRPALYK